MRFGKKFEHEKFEHEKFEYDKFETGKFEIIKLRLAIKFALVIKIEVGNQVLSLRLVIKLEISVL